MFVFWGMASRLLIMCLFCLLCFSQHVANCFFGLYACALSPRILLLCVRASCVSSVPVYLLLRLLTSFQSCIELVFSVILLSVLCQRSLCYSIISLSISVL